MRPSRQNEELAELKLLGCPRAPRPSKPMHARVCARLAVSENLRGGLAQAPRDKSDVREARADAAAAFTSPPRGNASTRTPAHHLRSSALHRRRARIFRPEIRGRPENKSAMRRRRLHQYVRCGRRRRRRHRDATLAEMARARLREVGMDRLLRRSLYRRAGTLLGYRDGRRRCRRALARRSRQRRANDWARRWSRTLPALRASGCSPRLWPSTMAIGAASARRTRCGPALARSCLRCSSVPTRHTLSMQGAVGCAWLWMAAALPTLDDELASPEATRQRSSRSAPRRSCARW